jgi:hypothetical protein
VVAALCDDPDAARFTGRTVRVAELATDFGITDEVVVQDR